MQSNTYEPSLAAGNQRNSRASSRKIIAGLHRIPAKHLYRLLRELVQILTHEWKLLEDVSSSRDHVASNLVCLENVEQFSWTRPYQLSVCIVHHRHRFAHQRHRIASRVGDTAGKHRNIGARL